MIQLPHPYMTIRKTVTLTIWTFVGQVMSLLFQMHSRFIIAFLPRSKHLLISRLQSPSTVILEPKKIKSVTVSTFFPFYLSWSNGTGCHDLSFLNAEFQASFTFSKRQFSSSSLSAIRVVSSAYLRLLIFLPAILIPACDSSCPTFRMMYSAQKLNKQGDNIQPCCTPFPILNQPVLPCKDLAVATWHAYRFLKR